MKKINFFNEINNNFLNKFRIKKKTLYIFNFFPLILIKILYVIKKIIKQ